MDKLCLRVMIFVVALFTAHSAGAFSTDQSANQNSDGSQKFSDPDEQMPGFMVGPNDGNMENKSLSFGHDAVTVPTQGDSDRGARAFDQAFSHQQDKE